MRVVIAEAGAPWMALVMPASPITLVRAQTPGEPPSEFGRRVSSKLSELASREIADIVLVTRPRARESESARARWNLETLAREHHPTLVTRDLPAA